ACCSPRAARAMRSSGQPYAQALLQVLLQRDAVVELRERGAEVAEDQRGERLAHETNEHRVALLDDARDRHVLFTADDHQGEVEAEAVLRRVDGARDARLAARDPMERGAVEREAPFGDVEEAVDQAVERVVSAERLYGARDALGVLDP